MTNVQRYAKCAAPGCFDTPRKFSRYCGFHYRRLERTRDLRGRVLTKGELRGHRELACEFLDANAMHPAVIAAHEIMADFLRDDGRAGFLKGEFKRLSENGATPRAMLAAFLAVWGWADCHEQDLADRCVDLNLGRAVLSVVPARRCKSKRGKTYYARVSPGHAEALGQNLRSDLGLFALQSVKHIERMAARGHVNTERIKAALETVPFVAAGEPASPPTTGEDESK